MDMMLQGFQQRVLGTFVTMQFEEWYQGRETVPLLFSTQELT